MGIHRRGRRGGTWLLVAADPQTDEVGRVTQVISTFSDITERRAFEARLAVSDRLAAMGTLTAGIGHEINNPLAFITANLTYIGAELDDVAALSDAGRMQEIRAAVQEAREGADRLRRIVAEMRTLARGDGRNRLVDLNRIAQSAARPIISELRTRARVTTRLSDVPPVQGDEARLGQVLLNLLLNAADAIPEGDPAAHEITVSTFSTFAADGGTRAVLEVRDTGQGIAPELRERIFDPFFTAKPVGSGRGLGLAICHHIVSALGGNITVESAPGRGSVFRVSLPGVPEQLPAGV
jgi:signal transduction histidine kinase